MAELNNIPEADDTKTRVTSKITGDTPGKSAPAINLDTPKVDSSTLTRRTVKLQGLAGLTSAPKPAPAPAPAQAQGDEDTRTRRTLKLSSLANGPSVKPLNINKPASAPAAPAASKPTGEKISMKTTAVDTVTRRTQKLEALDTQDVIAMTEADLASSDTMTRKTSKPVDPVNSAAAPVPKPRQTVRVDGIAPAHTPVIDLDAKPGDTNTRKTVKLEAPEAAAADIDLDAPAGDDTRTRKSVKTDAPAAPAKFQASNVDDTVKLQRPAPKPVMPGSVAPAAQGGSSAVGGIKLNKPRGTAAAAKAAAAKAAQDGAAPADAPGAAPAAAPAAAPGAAPAAAPAADQKKDKLKVNTDALKDLGPAPVPQGVGAEGMPVGVDTMSSAPRRDSLVLNIIFAFFGVLAVLLLIFVAAIAVVDHVNIWVKDSSAKKIELPLVADYIQKAEYTPVESPESPAEEGEQQGGDQSGSETGE